MHGALGVPHYTIVCQALQNFLTFSDHQKEPFHLADHALGLQQRYQQFSGE